MHFQGSASFVAALFAFTTSVGVLHGMTACGGDTGEEDAADSAGADTAPLDDTLEGDAAAEDVVGGDGAGPDGDGPDSTGDTVVPEACAGVSCENAPCQVNARCTAESAPACVYDTAPDDTACDLLGTGDGVCEAGACRLPPQPCTANAQCTQEGTSCVQGLCAPKGVTGAPCEEVDDCTPGHQCNISGSCIGDLDVPCEDDDDCIATCHEGMCSRDSRFGGPCAAQFSNIGCLPGLLCGENFTCVHGPGGACTDNADCLESVCFQDKGTCVVEDGRPCDDNDQCREACIISYCGPRSPFGWPCNDEGDCQEQLACDTSINQCRMADGGPCLEDAYCLSDSACSPTSEPGVGTCTRRADLGEPCGENARCVSTARCADGICAPLSEPGEPCAETSDCSRGTCAGGTCGLANGAACSSNDECVTTCVQGICAAPCLTCDCDDADDCGDSFVCDLDGGEFPLICKYPLGTECSFSGPDALCINGYCSARRCADPSEAGGPCLAQEDCAPGLQCAADKTCGKPNGAACAANAECLNTCLGDVCGDFLGFNAACTSDSEDCGPGLACTGGRCLSSDPGYCECRTFQGQCIGTINDECNPGFRPSRQSPCSCPTTCECVPN